MFRRFKKSFSFKNEAGQKVTIPRNWAGELPDQIAADADAAGATLIDKVKKAAEQPASSPKTIDEMTKDELIAEAAKRNVEIKTSDNKADILAALEAAEQPAS
ncbi:hypothetical protein [Devosia naphthalenivorans]|uniref:hypothetical protein n=1 Tax=Devosia naphthalenivorans TaxID=2082392 RepID=UPI000D3A630E|nr:hypothetical protein [Devosia naphthalenivorans]